MFRPNYGADFLNNIGHEGDTLLLSVAGKPVVLSPADVAQGAAPDEIKTAVNKALYQYDSVRTDAAGTGTQATASVINTASLNPITAIQEWWSGVQNDINRTLVGVLGIGIVIVALFFFSKE